MSGHSRARHDGEEDPLAARKRSTWEIVYRVGRYLKPYPWLATGTMACALLSLACSFVYPKLVGNIVNEVVAGARVNHLTWSAIGLLVAFFLRDLFNSIRIRINNTFEQNVIFDMRREVYGRLQRLPVNYFDQRSSGDLMTRVIEDVNSVERVLIDGTEQGVVSLLSIAGVLIILFWSNTTLAWVALAPIPFLAAGALAYTLTAKNRYRKQRIAASAMNALLMDNLSGVRQIKSFARETHEDMRFGQRAEDLKQGTLEVMRAWALYSPAMSFAAAAGMGLVLWVGGRAVIAGEMEVGSLVGFLFYLSLFYEPINRLHGLNQMLQAARAAGERVFDILDTPSETHPTATVPSWPGRVRGEVIYDKVGFHYQADRPILRSVSLHARPGAVVALVGPTGAGKSTLVNLLPAFYELSEGSITIDGRDIRQIPLELLRSQISVVSQEPFLFNGTIAENILYGRLGATQVEMEAAARAANCHDFIARLPQGYQSKVGERGVKLSVGEKQRISIARALLKDTPILILDEATASVDTATELMIQEALGHLMKNRTSFVIAHRLSTIRSADQILVIREGSIAEQGTHDQLIAAGGLYAKLCQIQNTTFIEEGFAKLNG